MPTQTLGSLAVLLFLFVHTTMTWVVEPAPTAGLVVDPVFMTGVVAICAIVVFALTIVAIVIVGNEGTAKAALKTLVELWRSFWS